MLKMKPNNLSMSLILMLTLTVKVNSQACDFEDDFCGWKNGSWSDGSWIRGTRATLTRNTGPQSAFTGNYYAYLNARDYRDRFNIVQAGKKVVIVSPVLSTNVSSTCFLLYYYMYGTAVSNLIVGTVDVNEDENSRQEIFQRTGNQGQTWHCGGFTVSTTPRKRIYIEAITGANIQSDIAIDALALLPSNCESVGACSKQKENIINNERTSPTDSTTSIMNITSTISKAGKTGSNEDDNILLFAVLIPAGLLIIVAILAVIFYKKSKTTVTMDEHTPYQNPLYNQQDGGMAEQVYSYSKEYEYPYDKAPHPPPLPTLESRM